MEFFNKKEEVLDFQLTDYGKHMLSLGQWKPAYYAFYDGDILYDTAAISGSGYEEKQNKNDRRIKYGAPTLKPIATRSGAETRVNQFQSNLIMNGNDPALNVQQFNVNVFEDTEALGAYNLGDSSLMSPYNPAWSIEVLSKPVMSSSQGYIDNSGLIEKIPQIDITMDYETYFSSELLDNNVISSWLGESGFRLALKENYLMIEVIEENTTYEKQNFEIEVFHSGTDGKYTSLAFLSTTAPTITPPLPLPASGPSSAHSSTTIENQVGNVEYYMNLLVDNNIPEAVIQELNISDRAISTNARRLRLNRDLYTTVNEDPCE